MKTISLKVFNTIDFVLLAIIVIFIFSASQISCKKEGKENAEKLCPVVAPGAVPQLVKDSFAARYPATNVTTWFNKDSVAFCAFFVNSASIEKLAQFANNGSFIKEEVEIHQDGHHEDDTTTVAGSKTATGGCECETHKVHD